MKRCVPLSVSRSRALVASAAEETAVEEIAVAGIGVGVIAAVVRLPVVVKLLVDVKLLVVVNLLVDVSLAAGIRGWIRCGSGLRRVVRGRVRRMTKLSI